jgi:Ser/Thr protein kinase RdoA (MazF antagonist)
MRPFQSLSMRGQLQRLGTLARTALTHYHLNDPRITPLRHEANTTFRVITAGGEQYVMRIQRPGQRTLEAIHSEILWLNALRRDTNLAVPEPIPTQEGDFLVTVTVAGVPEPRTCVLFRWMAGRFLTDYLKPIHLDRLGRFIGQLHRHTANWQIPAQFVRGRVESMSGNARQNSRYDPFTTPTNSTPHLSEADVTQTVSLVRSLCSTEDVRNVERALDHVQIVLHALGTGADTFGLIHADLHQENHFFHQGQVRAIDFDDCGWGHYLYDLMVPLWATQFSPIYPALRLALLNGYRAVQPLSPDHENYLPAFFALRQIQILVWVLESRDHPAFRSVWVEWARTELERLEQVLIKE